MREDWFYVHDGSRIGPVSPAALKQLATAGMLLPDDLVWKSEMSNWVAAKRLRGLEFATIPQVSEKPLPSKVWAIAKIGAIASASALTLVILLGLAIFLYFLTRSSSPRAQHSSAAVARTAPADPAPAVALSDKQEAWLRLMPPELMREIRSKSVREQATMMDALILIEMKEFSKLSSSQWEFVSRYFALYVKELIGLPRDEWLALPVRSQIHVYDSIEIWMLNQGATKIEASEFKSFASRYMESAPPATMLKDAMVAYGNKIRESRHQAGLNDVKSFLEFTINAAQAVDAVKSASR